MQLVALCKKIYPDIIGNTKLNVQFVPVRSYQTKQFIAGAYVIRIKIDCGERDSVYFFNWKDEDMFTFRQEKEVIVRSTRQALEEQKNRARRALDLPAKLHDGPCMHP